MSFQLWATAAASGRQSTNLFRRGFRAVIVVGGLTAAAGCTATSKPIVGSDPSDSTVRVPTVAYRSTLGAYRSQRPVEPGDWAGTNERIAPQPKPGE